VRDVDLGLLVGRGVAHRGVDAALIRALTSDWIDERLPCERSTAKHPYRQRCICFDSHRSRSRSDVSPFAGNRASRDVLVAADSAAKRRLTAAKAACLSVTPGLVDGRRRIARENAILQSNHDTSA
jgi:hypothetical protein